MKAQRIDGKAISDQIKKKLPWKHKSYSGRGLPPALLWFWWGTTPLPWYM